MIKTQLLTEKDIEAAAAILRAGGLVGIPTETVYGLGANGLDPAAVRRIFEAKGRPQDNPLILHIPDPSWLERYCRDVPAAARRLAEQFWPGPLTMILPRRALVPDEVTCGLETVGVRCPDHPVTLDIIRAAGVPVAAPSGNRSGRPSPTCARHMLEDMEGRIQAVVDGGPCGVGVESTIVDLTLPVPRLLRPGGGAATAAYIRRQAGANTGVICFGEYRDRFPGCTVRSIGPAGDRGEQARRVFDALRSFDGTSVTAIFAQCPGEEGLGLAVANRLKKAAGFQIVAAEEGEP